MKYVTAARFGILPLVLTVGCAFRDGKKTAAAPPVPPPKPAAAAPKPAIPDAPYSTLQTDVALPSPQPVSAAAMAAVPQPPPPKEPEPADAPRPRRPTTTTAQTTVTPDPPPAPVQPPRRVRVTETAQDRKRILSEVEKRRLEIEDNLNKAQRRQLSSEERTATERARAFLVQAAAAVKKNDLQEADELSRRALLLSRDLSRE